MSAESEQSKSPIYFPLDQGERASHLNVNQLLARDVYEQLAQMLAESLPSDESNVLGDDEQFNRGRGHSSIFLDGDRGTGKTTVVVNLRKYLEAPEVKERLPDLAEAVHIFKPIDPSQLEDGDDLFLNVVVAAVLGDRDVNAQREKRPEQWVSLHTALQALGNALQGRETQSDGVGLDRLRAFMGSQELAGAVHRFFEAASLLLGKRLLVLPIDDVDTTLHRAFENLEVVRRYLASPVLLPVVCGDLNLYREVTRRDAFKRLTMDTTQESARAWSIAEELAREYLRKILPLHRRLQMPSVLGHLSNYNIVLGPEGNREARKRLKLPHLEMWLQALLAGPVNGNQNSQLQIPIPTVRALSQLIARVSNEVPALEETYFNEAQAVPETDLMRRMSYLRDGQTAGRRRRAQLRSQVPSDVQSRVSLQRWEQELLSHFMFEPSAGAVCLILLARQHWRTKRSGSVLDTPLFQPAEQLSRPELRYIETRAPLEWSTDLGARLPGSWMRSLASESVLPFATPELGRAVKPGHWELKETPDAESLLPARARFLRGLITHFDYYNESKRSTLICSGRILELVVTSLVRKVVVDDIERIAAAAPFHSAASIGAKHAVRFSVDDIEAYSIDADSDAEEPSEVLAPDDGEFDLDRDLVVDELARSIENWRNEHRLEELALSPWLIYCALNKTLNQVPLFTRPLSSGQQPTAESLSNVYASGMAAFNAFWAALASFEKGPIFDLRSEVSTVNLLNRRGEFLRNNLYLQNIKPLVDMPSSHSTVHGEQVHSITRVLADHPLRKALGTSFEAACLYETEIAREEMETEGRIYLLKVLGISDSAARLTSAAIQEAMERLGPKGAPLVGLAHEILRDVGKRYPKHSLLGALRRAVKELERTLGSSRP